MRDKSTRRPPNFRQPTPRQQAMRPGTMAESAAEALGLKALVFVTEDEGRLFRFLAECFGAGAGNRIIFCLAIVLGLFPCAFNPALLLQSDKGRVERALVQVEQILRYVLQTCGDSVSMLRPHGCECSEDDQIEGALQKLDA